MKNNRRLAVTALLLAMGISLAAGYGLHTLHAQDAAPAAIATPVETVDQIMGLIGRGRIDEAISMMDGMKNQPDAREEARGRLARLPSDEGPYRGYDVAATQRFINGQFETMDVIAYYDDQPVLFRFHFYRPQVTDNVKWTVLGFQVTTALQQITEVLKDTPIDYVGRTKR